MQHLAGSSQVFPSSPLPVWKFPPSGCLKINCDATMDLKNGFAAIACVVRDAASRIIKGETCIVPSFSVAIAEALAVRQRVMLAIKEGWDHVIF
ncbi:hypothetical protein V6N13_087347 [Hibiscus sabdariffa]